MILLAITLFIITVILLILFLVPWIVHLDMSKGERDCEAIGYGNFNTFIKEFNKINWEFDCEFEKSLFLRKEKSKIHATIFKFNNKVMIMRSPVDYHRAERYAKQYIKNNFSHKSKINKNYKWE